MRARSLIDDVTLYEEDDKGDPILFENPQIRKMLRLAGTRRSDVFYDLGCGWGQNLIVALTEFKVKKAVGVEQDRERHAKSLGRLQKRGLTDRGTVVWGKFEKAFAGKLKGVDLNEASVVFYGLSTEGVLKGIKKTVKRGCRLVYYYDCLFPEIKPERVNFPFYVSVAPFKKPRSESEWLAAVVPKVGSSIQKGRPSVEELWDELSHDYEVNHHPEDVVDFKRRLRKLVGS
jgi:precorrin-6B methylase 2